MSRFALVLVLLSGCSIAFQSKPSKTAGVASSECSTSKAWWIADAVGVAAGIAAVALTYAVQDVRESNDRNALAGAGVMTSLAYTASMGNGIRWAGQCREQQAAPGSLALHDAR